MRILYHRRNVFQFDKFKRKVRHNIAGQRWPKLDTQTVQRSERSSERVWHNNLLPERRLPQAVVCRLFQDIFGDVILANSYLDGTNFGMLS